MLVHVNGINIAYTDAGIGIPLLLIHGYPLNRYLWEPQVDELYLQSRVLAPDLRGHGESQSVPGPYSMDVFADDLNSFLNILNITQPVVICGISMGGYIAFAFYRRFAARVAGLVLVATRAKGDSPEAKAGRDKAMLTANQQGVAAIVDSMLPKMFSPKTYSQKPELVEQVRSIMSRTSLEGVLGDLRSMKARPDSTPTLSQIKSPTLILAGADDQIIPLKETQAMQASIAKSRLVVIPDTGHLLNLENPSTFNQAIREFLSEDLANQ